MATFDLNVQTIKRAERRSIVAASAYRGGGRLYDERNQIVHNYSRRRGIQSEIMLPDGMTGPLTSTPHALDRAREWLWNSAEAAEVRSNAVVGREIRVAIPIELSKAEGRSLVRRYIRKHLVDRHLVIAEIAFHNAPPGGDPRNRHAHILFTSRRIRDDLTFGSKTRELDDRRSGSAIIASLRRTWSAMTNAALRLAGSDRRISYKSLVRLEHDLERGLHLKLPDNQPRRTDFVPNEKRRPGVTRLLRSATANVAYYEARLREIGFELLAEDWKAAPIDDIVIVNAALAVGAWEEAGDQLRAAEAERLLREAALTVPRPRAEEALPSVPKPAGLRRATDNMGLQVTILSAGEHRDTFRPPGTAAEHAALLKRALEVSQKRNAERQARYYKALKAECDRIDWPGRILSEGELDAKSPAIKRMPGEPPGIPADEARRQIERVHDQRRREDQADAEDRQIEAKGRDRAAEKAEAKRLAKEARGRTKTPILGLPKLPRLPRMPGSTRKPRVRRLKSKGRGE